MALLDNHQDNTNEKMQEELRNRQSRSSDCDKIEKKSKKVMGVMLVIAILTSTLFITSAYLGSSAIISVRYNFSGVNVTPTQAIPIDYNGTYASSTNATFTPLYIFIGLLYPKTDPIFHKELYVSQYPNNIVSSDLVASINQLDEFDDYFFASSFHFINDTQDTTINVRMSADYTVLFKVIVLIQFNDNSIPDQTISFYFIQNYGQPDLFGRPTGICTFGLTRTNTLLLNITGLNYNYDSLKTFYQKWSSDYQVVGYPFTINGVLTNAYDWNNFWGVN